MKERTMTEIVTILRGYTNISLKALALELGLKYSSLISARNRNSIAYKRINLFCIENNIDIKFVYFEELKIEKEEKHKQSDIYEVMNILKDIDDAK